MKLNNIYFFILIIINSVSAQTFSGGYNFYMPPFDSTSQKFLPNFPIKPIEPNCFISINNIGNFSLNNERIKFWGANLVADGAFPPKTSADGIASRIRKIGFNLIRFHHLDNNWTSGSLFYQTQNTRTLNSVNLDKLEFLISKLKLNGIFVNMNLNVGRTFKISDGVIDADSLIDYAKGVTIFDPKLIELQKEYATQLLTHVNPYTNLSLVNDPVMAMVEVINENSLFRMWKSGKLIPRAEGGSLTYRHSKMLDSLWNNYLLNKYISTNNLNSAWLVGANYNIGLNQVLNPDFEILPINTYWSLELHNGCLASMTKDILNPYNGLLSAKVSVTNTTGTYWHLQWRQTGLSFEKDSTYIIQFAARSDVARKINVTVSNQNSPYTYYGGKEFNLTPYWKVFSFTVKASEAAIATTKLAFQFEGNGIYWFDDIKLTKAPIQGLIAGESLENKNIVRNNYTDLIGFTENRIKDISDFYYSLESNFYLEMKNFLKNTLGVKVPIVGTNWNIGVQDLMVQDKMDYIDNHAYWDHPTFPNEDWSNTDWLIKNTSMIFEDDNSTISNLFSFNKIKGKPYTISEYNHPFPNRFQCEMPIFLSAYSSFHNIDGIMYFDYNDSYDCSTDKVLGYFNLNRNSVVMALNPTVSYVFQNDLIKTANNVYSINFNKDSIFVLPKYDNSSWERYQFFDPKIVFEHSVDISSFDAPFNTDFTGFPEYNQTTYTTDTQEIILNNEGLLTVNTPKYIGITGKLNNFNNIELGNLKLVNASDFGTITWVSLKADSLSNSSLSLLTVVSKIQNTNMIWSGTTSINNNWGSAPTQLSPLNFTANIKINADSIWLYPLLPTGQAIESQKITVYPSSPNCFEIIINQEETKTPWFGIEAFINNTDLKYDDFKADYEFNLENNFPNPFNNSTKINFTIADKSVVNLTIYDILGNKIKELVNSNYIPGKYSIYWNGDNDKNTSVSTGIYFIRLNTNKHSQTIKSILLK